MANEENLIRNEERTPSERRENARKAGKASGEARRKKRDMKKTMEMLLQLSPRTKEDYENLAAAGINLNTIDDEELSNMLVVNAALLNRAKTGDVNAVKELRSIIHDDDSYTKHKIKMDNVKMQLEKQKTDPQKTKQKIYGGIPAELIAPNFSSVLFDIREKQHSEYVFPGGRGSTKSSFISLNVINLMMTNEQLHACVLRQVGDTLRNSVYQQIQWAISALGLEDEFKCTVSPLEITKIKTGQKIYFRGADDPNKIKSIKTPFGYIGIIWFEELDQFSGEESVRKIEQSVIRGGDDTYKFKSFNPPKSAQNWANKYVKIPRADRLVFESTYLTVPKQWLGKSFIDDAEFLKQTNPTAYENEYLGVANGTGGNVFDNVIIREITEEEIRIFDRLYKGVDWGWYPDPFAYNNMTYIASQHRLIIFDEYHCHKQSNEQTAAVLKSRGVNSSDVVMCDSAEKKSVSDYRAFGLSARAAEKGPGSVEYSMKWLQSLKEIVIDNKRCPETAKEFLNYEYDRDREGNVISGYPDKNNHHIDAVRYATNGIWKRRGQ